MKELILLRGLPGAGKTELAGILSLLEVPFFKIATDDYWEREDIEGFDTEKLNEAHEWAEGQVRDQMGKSCPVIAVHNTFTQPWEWEEYERMAEAYHYRVHHIIVEKRHDGTSTSDVPQRTIDNMESRFQIRLQ